MVSVAQIEDSIQTLPAQESSSLVGWIPDRHLEIPSADEFETEALEAELLKSLNSPRRLVNDALFDDIRAAAQN